MADKQIREVDDTSDDELWSDPEIEEINQRRKKRLRELEQQFGMTSAEFLRRWHEDTMPDLFETNEWAILLDSE